MLYILLIFVSALLIFINYFNPTSPMPIDLGYYLKSGEIILQTKHIASINLFSFTNTNYFFHNTSWLGNVIFYIIYNHFGEIGLTLLTILTIFTSFLLLYLYTYKKVSILAQIITFLLFFIILHTRNVARPEILSFFFIAFFIYILYKDHEKKTKLFYLLPIIELLWINTHIYYVLGPAFLLIYTFSDFLDKRRQVFTRNNIITLLSCIACLFNPDALIGAFYPLMALSNYAYPINENQPLFSAFFDSYSFSSNIFFLCCSGLLLYDFIFYKKYFSYFEIIITLFAILLGVFAVRNEAVFVFVAFIPFMLIMHLFILSLRKKHKNTTYMLLFLSFIILGYACFLAYDTNTQVSQSQDMKPGVDFFIKHKLKEPIFNNLEIGSYLDYRLYPGKKTFIDARPEAYPPSFFEQVYFPMLEDKNTFDKLAQSYHIQTIIINHVYSNPPIDQFVKTIMNDPNWSIVYIDSATIILVKNLLTLPTIQHDSMQHITLPSDQSNLTALALLFYRAGWNNDFKNILLKLIALNPQDCKVLFSLNQLSIYYPDLLSYSLQFHRDCPQQ